MNPAVRTLSSALLYAPGAFFFYPWKPVMNALVGDSYDTAYAHFRRDHSDAHNLVLHVVAFVLQVLGNFGLLNFLDQFALVPSLVAVLPPVLAARCISTLSAGTWILLLAVQPAPLLAKALSATSISAALCAAPLLSAPALDDVSLLLFLCAIPLGLALENRRSRVRKGVVEVAKDLAKYAAVAGLLQGARHLPQSKHWMNGALVGDIALPNAVLLCVVFAAACLPLPVVPVTIVGAVGTRVVFALTGQEYVLFWGCAFSGMVLQGRAHDISKQQATLLNLEGVQDKDKKLRFEWAHVTFFPTLLWHSIYDSTLGGNKTSAKKAARD